MNPGTEHVISEYAYINDISNTTTDDNSSFTFYNKIFSVDFYKILIHVYQYEITEKGPYIPDIT